MRNVGRSGVSQNPLAVVYNLRSVCEANLSDEGPFFSTGTVVFYPKRVDANLGQEGGGLGAGGERDRVAAGTVAVHRGGRLADRWLRTRPRWRAPLAEAPMKEGRQRFPPVF